MSFYSLFLVGFPNWKQTRKKIFPLSILTGSSQALWTREHFLSFSCLSLRTGGPQSHQCHLCPRNKRTEGSHQRTSSTGDLYLPTCWVVYITICQSSRSSLCYLVSDHGHGSGMLCIPTWVSFNLKSKTQTQHLQSHLAICLLCLLFRGWNHLPG